MELHVMVEGVLGLIGCVYMLAFWGSAIFKGCYSYLQDGDKCVRDLCDYIYYKFWSSRSVGWCSGSTDGMDYILYGVITPLGYVCFVMMMVILTKLIGILLPIILTSILAAFLLLYIMRAVIRLNKKLDKHTSDKDAHK